MILNNPLFHCVHLLSLHLGPPFSAAVFLPQKQGRGRRFASPGSPRCGFPSGFCKAGRPCGSCYLPGHPSVCVRFLCNLDSLAFLGSYSFVFLCIPFTILAMLDEFPARRRWLNIEHHESQRLVFRTIRVYHRGVRRCCWPRCA